MNSNSFSNVIAYVAPNMPYDTIQVVLPDEAKQIARAALAQFGGLYLKKYALESDYKLHVTLRYLGNASDELSTQIIRDESIFSQKLKGIGGMKVVVRGVVIHEDPYGQLRLNWGIQNKHDFAALHQALLEVPGYSFFDGLEGNHYNPHILIAKADRSVPDIRKQLAKCSTQLLPQELSFEIQAASIIITSVHPETHMVNTQERLLVLS